MIDEPAARPSSPSVRFTACDDDVSTMNAQTKKNAPSAIPVGRRNDRLRGDPGLVRRVVTKTANATETMRRPEELLPLRSDPAIAAAAPS